jgi:drug/metabolite transporter (DMT)-like permease
VRAESGALRVVVLATLAMTAFAANSVLARLALGGEEAGPASFTVLRVVSGAVVLALLAARTSTSGQPRSWMSQGSWASGAMLVVYAAAFSLAYVTLGAAVGALVLFAVVQLVIFVVAWRSGERPRLMTWLGLGLAALGLAALAAPGAAAPDAAGFVLMALAGVAWAGYTLSGRGTTSPLDATAGNFVRGVPVALLVMIPILVADPASGRLTAVGAAYAVLSGAAASGIGYAIWYAVLPSLSRTQSGIIQLSPAPLAAVGGLLLIGEPITPRVVVASLLILGGVALGLTPPREEGAAEPGSHGAHERSPGSQRSGR